ncbi:hypothetical protein ACFWQ3_002350 [Salmonella enterica]|uniref:hypothetical protein n=1 Tax=Salmonella enterica TaxID=28901 RepID=UPI0021176096|nr:hypothetical protein [Salmonella enterica]
MPSRSRASQTQTVGRTNIVKQIACQHSGGNHQPWPKRLAAFTPLANPIGAKPTTIAPVVISTGRNRIYNTIS